MSYGILRIGKTAKICSAQHNSWKKQNSNDSANLKLPDFQIPIH
jgi:hypothetical protein